MDTKAATKSGSKTGTLALSTVIGTTPSYVEALRVDTRGCGVQGKTVFNIKNTATGTSLYFKINAYTTDYDGTIGETAIAQQAESYIASATASPNWTVVAGYAAVVVSFRNFTWSTTATVASYRIDYTTY
jgi:hypothetical protein